MFGLFKKRRLENAQYVDELLKAVSIVKPGQTIVFRYAGKLTPEARLNLSRALHSCCTYSDVKFIMLEEDMSIEAIIDEVPTAKE